MRLDSLIERVAYKNGPLTLQDARLLCDKCMVYAAVREGLDAEPAIRLPDRKDSIQNQVP